MGSLAISQPVDWSQKSGHLQRLLMDYTDYKSYASLKEYIDAGGNVNVQIVHSQTRTTPLCEASKRYDVSAMYTLFRTNCDVNFQDGNGNTPLFHAARNHKSGSVHVLLKKQAEPDIKNKWGNTPLTVALENFSHHCVTLLIDAGASVNTPIKSWSIQRHLPSYVGDTVSPLLFVLMSSPAPFPMARKLIYAGALVEHMPEALISGLLIRPGDHYDFVHLLLEAGFRVTCTSWTKSQRAELEMGAIEEKNELMLSLIEQSHLSPPSLQTICRAAIRRAVVLSKSPRGHVTVKIDKLQLPRRILLYLKLETVCRSREML